MKTRGETPARWSAIVFFVKSNLLRVRRRLGKQTRKISPSAVKIVGEVLEHRSPLWTSQVSEERQLQLGKIQNLRLAVRAFDGVVLAPGQEISFWAQVGRASRQRGFAPGRELREGCIIPTIGGGLCQLSNALYDLYLRAGFEIVERHPHSMVVPGSATEAGRDATVFWNYIDLRARANTNSRIEARITSEELVVRLIGSGERSQPKPRTIRLLQAGPGSCETCGEAECFRHASRSAKEARVSGAKRAYLLDACSPEFNRRLSLADPVDLALIPLDGNRWNVPRYGWTSPCSTKVHTIQTIQRSLAARRHGSPPEIRARSIEAAQTLGELYASQTPFDADSLAVDITLLPFVGTALAGRPYEVWLTRAPLKLLHEILDRAATEDPALELRDFRAAKSLVDLEWDLLLQSSRVVTPHLELARLLRDLVSVELIDWELPDVQPAGRGTGVYFPGTQQTREGGETVRRAVEELGLPWASSLEGCRVVVYPAAFKNRPAALLKALALQKPIVATRGCGVQANAFVEFGDISAVRNALSALYE